MIATEALSLLERKDVKKSTPVERQEFVAELAAKSKKLLDYDPAAAGIEEGELVSPEAVLAELEIKPFTAESVTKYQNEMIWGSAPWLVRFYGTRWGAALDYFTHVLTFASIGGILLSIVGFCVEVSWTRPGWLMGISIAGAVLSLAVGILVFGKAAEYKHAKWNRVRIRNCQVAIPTFAISTAIQIKERLPAAEFFVETLERGEFVKERLDPFLALFVGHQIFYLEVWDEEGFHHPRQI